MERVPCGVRAALPRRLAGLLDPAEAYLEAHRAEHTTPLVPVRDDPLARFTERRQRAAAMALRHRAPLEAAARQLVAEGSAAVDTTDGKLTVRLLRFRHGDHVLEVTRPPKGPRRRSAGEAAVRRTRVPRRRGSDLVAVLVDRLAWEVTGIGRAAVPARPVRRGVEAP